MKVKKVYLAISYSKRELFNKEVNALKSLFNSYGIELLVFVDKYNFQQSEEKVMMNAAFGEIDSCDLLIAELTIKSIGVGIEMGYAYSKEIPICYIRRTGSEYSTTAAGCASSIIEYDGIDMLVREIKLLMNK
jgi:nucleoside 2-deoxyribosyltransferase